jgi:hypothetical protein
MRPPNQPPASPNPIDPSDRNTANVDANNNRKIPVTKHYRQ